MAPPTLFGARVKSVLSADTLVLTPLNKPATAENERLLNLAFVSGPRLSGNEAYGFEAREYMRTLLVGKAIQFRVLYTVNEREFGDIVAPVFASLIEKALGDGIVSLREDSESKESFEQYADAFLAAQNKAKKSKAGIWADNKPAAVVPVNAVPEDIYGTKRQIPSVIERVIAGDRVQVRSFLGKDRQFLGQVLVAGISAPRSASSMQAAEPFGEEAKLFVTERLLQRSVRVEFLAPNNNGIPIAIVTHPNGDVSQLLLEAGFATVADWQSEFVGAERMSALRQKERAAKLEGKNIWKAAAGATTKPAAGSSAKARVFDATVSKVVSADTYVLLTADGVERTVSLASVRAPRKNDSAQEPYVAPSKEFARAKFIGKKAHVTVEAVRPKQENLDERDLVTMVVDNQNVANLLIDNGMVTVIRHRKGADDRSPYWDEFVEREKAAQAANKGIFAKKPPPPDRTVDASETVTKARGFLSSLERQSRVNGIVDYISSGSRFRIKVPRENCILTLVLGGVRVPRPQEDHGDVALKWVSDRLWQRDVQLSVFNVDKTGSFVGNLYLPGKNTPVSVALAKEGLAEVHTGSASQSGYLDELENAQEKAQKQKLGIWANYDAEQEKAAAAAAAAAAAPAAATTPTATGPQTKYIDIVVTDVSDSGDISYCTRSSEQQYAKLNAELTSFNNSAANSTTFAFKGLPRRNELVTVQQDGSFVRGRVVMFEKPDTFTVELIDTGKVSTFRGTTKLRPLPKQFDTAALPPRAKSAELTFVERPPQSYLDDYVTYLREKLIGKSLVANQDSPANAQQLQVTLYTADSKGKDDSINNRLVYDGYAFVTRKLPAWAISDAWKAIVSTLEESQDFAKSDRVGVWEYGDPRDDE